MAVIVMTGEFQHVYSQSMKPLELVSSAYRAALSTWLCPECKSPRPDTGPIDVIVENPGLKSDSAMNSVAGCGVGVARKDFLVALGWDQIKEDFYLGNIFSGDGVVSERLVTFKGKVAVLVRGSKAVSHRKCGTCGKLLYFSLIGHRYLHPAPPIGVSFSESQLCGIVMPDQVASMVDFKQWRRLTHESLAVLAEPLDGLGELTPLDD